MRNNKVANLDGIQAGVAGTDHRGVDRLPAIVALPQDNGKLLAITKRRGNDDQSYEQIFTQVLHQSGGIARPEKHIVAGDNVKTEKYSPVACQLSTGDNLVAWNQRVVGEAKIVIALVDSEGNPKTVAGKTNTVLASTDIGRYNTIAAVALSNGQFLLTYYDYQTPSHRARVFNGNDFTAVGDWFTLSAPTANGQEIDNDHWWVFARADDSIVTVWTEQNANADKAVVAASVTSQSGASLVAPTILDSNATGSKKLLNNAAYLPTDQLVIVTNQGADPIDAQIFSAATLQSSVAKKSIGVQGYQTSRGNQIAIIPLANQTVGFITRDEVGRDQLAGRYYTTTDLSAVGPYFPISHRRTTSTVSKYSDAIAVMLSNDSFMAFFGGFSLDFLPLQTRNALTVTHDVETSYIPGGIETVDLRSLTFSTDQAETTITIDVAAAAGEFDARTYGEGNQQATAAFDKTMGRLTISGKVPAVQFLLRDLLFHVNPAFKNPIQFQCKINDGHHAEYNTQWQITPSLHDLVANPMKTDNIMTASEQEKQSFLKTKLLRLSDGRQALIYYKVDHMTNARGLYIAFSDMQSQFANGVELSEHAGLSFNHWDALLNADDSVSIVWTVENVTTRISEVMGARVGSDGRMINAASLIFSLPFNHDFLSPRLAQAENGGSVLAYVDQVSGYLKLYAQTLSSSLKQNGDVVLLTDDLNTRLLIGAAREASYDFIRLKSNGNYAVLYLNSYYQTSLLNMAQLNQHDFSIIDDILTVFDSGDFIDDLPCALYEQPNGDCMIAVIQDSTESLVGRTVKLTSDKSMSACFYLGKMTKGGSGIDNKRPTMMFFENQQFMVLTEDAVNEHEFSARLYSHSKKRIGRPFGLIDSDLDVPSHVLQYYSIALNSQGNLTLIRPENTYSNGDLLQQSFYLGTALQLTPADNPIDSVLEPYQMHTNLSAFSILSPSYASTVTMKLDKPVGDLEAKMPNMPGIAAVNYNSATQTLIVSGAVPAVNTLIKTAVAFVREPQDVGQVTVDFQVDDGVNPVQRWGITLDVQSNVTAMSASTMASAIPASTSADIQSTTMQLATVNSASVTSFASTSSTTTPQQTTAALSTTAAATVATTRATDSATSTQEPEPTAAMVSSASRMGLWGVGTVKQWWQGTEPRAAIVPEYQMARLMQATGADARQSTMRTSLMPTVALDVNQSLFFLDYLMRLARQYWQASDDNAQVSSMSVTAQPTHAEADRWHQSDSASFLSQLSVLGGSESSAAAATAGEQPMPDLIDIEEHRAHQFSQ